MQKIIICSISYYYIDFMAKPIQATPVLQGKQAIQFLRQMKAQEQGPMNKKQKTIWARLQKNWKTFDAIQQ